LMAHPPRSDEPAAEHIPIRTAGITPAPAIEAGK